MLQNKVYFNDLIYHFENAAFYFLFFLKYDKPFI